MLQSGILLYNLIERLLGLICGDLPCRDDGFTGVGSLH